MERFNYKFENDYFVISLIILLVLVFIKSILYLLSLTKFRNIIISDEKLEKFRNVVSDMTNISLTIISLFVLLLRKNNSFTIIFLAILFLFKMFLHFFIDYNLNKYTNLNQRSLDNIIVIHEYLSFLTNLFLFIISFYMLKVIFIK
jgi:hypothetical protein